MSEAAEKVIHHGCCHECESQAVYGPERCERCRYTDEFMCGGDLRCNKLGLVEVEADGGGHFRSDRVVEERGIYVLVPKEKLDREALAQALWAFEYRGEDSWEMLPPKSREHYFKRADAILAHLGVKA